MLVTSASRRHAAARADILFLSSDFTVPHNNGAILNIAHIIKHVMTSATEAELAALYITAREAVYLRIILEEMGHKQPPTPLQPTMHGGSRLQQQNTTKTHQGNGHAFPLAAR